MTWSWRFEYVKGEPKEGSAETFPSQSEAESWLGQKWRDLAVDGVTNVHLLEQKSEEEVRTEYTMSLLTDATSSQSSSTPSSGSSA
jgi:hypothetical protein